MALPRVNANIRRNKRSHVLINIYICYLDATQKITERRIEDKSRKPQKKNDCYQRMIRPHHGMDQ